MNPFTKIVSKRIFLVMLATEITAFGDPMAAQFMSTVQLAVQEPSPELVERSQRLVAEQFASAIAMWPGLQGRPYEVRKSGNQLVFSLVSNSDMRVPLQQVVANMVQSLNGRVHAHGRTLFYRTSLSQPMGSYYVSVDDTHTKIVSIAAQSVPLRDLLREVRSQLGSLSYLIPGECMERLVDWSFGEDGVPSEPKTVDALMTELATLLGLKCEKKNGTYIFTGSCQDFPRPRRLPPPSPGELLQSGLFPNPNSPNPGRPQQVYFPLLPLGE